METSRRNDLNQTGTLQQRRRAPPSERESRGKNGVPLVEGVAKASPAVSHAGNGKRQMGIPPLARDHSPSRRSLEAGERINPGRSLPQKRGENVPKQSSPRQRGEVTATQSSPRSTGRPPQEQSPPHIDVGGPQRQPSSQKNGDLARIQPSPLRGGGASRQDRSSTRTARGSPQRELSPRSEGLLPVEKNGLCLLSLDGGGVRGLSSLLILQRLMDRMNEERAKSGLPSKKPCQVFDMIGGTSTGGLIAIMLGRLEMEVEDCIVEYVDMFRTIFGKKRRSFPVNLCGKVQSQFESGSLRHAIEKVVQEKTGCKDTAFRRDVEPGCRDDPKCRTFVCTTSYEMLSSVILRGYHSTSADNRINATIVEAGLATSAAPSFFDPVCIGACRYGDGGVGANNPVDNMWTEAQNIWCRGQGDLEPMLECLVSVGTGKPGSIGIGESAKGLLKSLQRITTETERTADSFADRHRSLLNKRYFRYNVEQGLQGIGLHEYKQQSKIQAATRQYLDQQERQRSLDGCADILKRKQSSTPLGFRNEVAAHESRIDAKAARAALNSASLTPCPHPAIFIGRENIMANLESLMGDREKYRRIALYGLGGIGKSRIALEAICRRKRAAHNPIQTFWVNAGTSQRLEKDYGQIAEAIGIDGWNSQDSQQDNISLVKEWLGGKIADEWILVIDGADDSALLYGESRMADFFPQSSKGTLLLTTRNREVGAKFAQSHKNLVEVPAFNEEESINLFRAKIGHKSPRQDCSRLANALQHVPLALVQSAAFMMERNMTPSKYLSLFEESDSAKIKLLSKDFEEELRRNYEKNPVAATFALSFEHINKTSPSAARILSRMSVLDARQVPALLLRSGEDSIAFSDALAPLTAFSLIIPAPTQPQSSEAYQLHRLVRLSMHGWLESRREFEATLEEATRSIHKHWPGKVDGKFEFYSRYSPHILSIMSLRKRYSPGLGARLPTVDPGIEASRIEASGIVAVWAQHLSRIIHALRAKDLDFGQVLLGLLSVDALVLHHFTNSMTRNSAHPAGASRVSKPRPQPQPKGLPALPPPRRRGRLTTGNASGAAASSQNPSTRKVIPP